MDLFPCFTIAEVMVIGWRRVRHLVNPFTCVPRVAVKRLITNLVILLISHFHLPLVTPSWGCLSTNSTKPSHI